MNTKRIIALVICAVMLLAMIPVMTISTAAAGEGMWTTFQGAGNYLAAGEEPDTSDDEDDADPPESGYEYTDDGLTIVQPDWTGVAPFMTVSTKDAQNLKEGIFLEFRVDAYEYGGEIGSDHWICLTLNSGFNEPDGTKSGKVAPGSPSYGGGWLTLLRGVGDGKAQSLPHLTNPKTDDFGGTFTNDGGVSDITVPTDDQGREIYTLEVSWTGSEYEIKVNGVVQGAQAATTTRLNALNPDGDFFVGISMMDGCKGGSAGLTILRYGTSEADATKPVGSDSKEAQANEIVYADIADPNTIEANKPAILWNPDTYNLKTGNNCSFAALGDNTWRCTATETAVFFNLSPKRSWSYDAVDFPVFGIMLRNIWVDSGTLWYAAGDYSGATNGLTVPFSVYDGEFYGSGEEYVFVPVDLTDLWEGRINSIRLDLAIADEANREFDVCFAGMFRSEEEAYTYAKEYLVTAGVLDPNATEAPETTAEPETAAPETNAPAGETNAPADETKAPAGETTAPAATTEGGCASVIGMSAVAVLAAAAAFVALKKKD